MKRYIVTLSEDEREALRQRVSQGKGAARKLLHAHILLKADTASGWRDQASVEAFDVSLSTVERVRQRFVEGPSSGKPPSGSTNVGWMGAHRVALVGSQPPDEHGRWTLKWLAQKLVALADVDRLAPETIRQTLKKMNVSPG